MAVTAVVEVFRQQQWRRQLPVVASVGLLVVTLAIGAGTLWEFLHGAWSSPYGVYSHGYPVVVLSLWMLVANWHRHPPARLSPSAWGFPVLLLVVGALVAATLMFIDGSRGLLLPPLVLATVLFVFGVQAALRVAPAALFLSLAVLPLWALREPLQALTTRVVDVLLRVSGDVPAYIEGNFVHLSVGTFEVAESCSGLSFMVAGLALAAFYAFTYLTRWRHRVLLVGIALGASLLSNWLRVHSLILIGYHTNMQSGLVDEHYFYGWVLFVVLFAPVILLARRLELREMAAGASPSPADGEPTEVSARVPAAAAVAAVLLVLPRLVDAGGAASVTDRLPDVAGVDGRVEGVTSGWRPAFEGAALGRAAYRVDGAVVEAVRAHYPVQGPRRHPFRSGNDVLGPDWRTESESRLVVSSTGVDAPVREVVGTIGGQRSLLWTWVRSAGEGVSDRAGARDAALRGTLRGRRDGVVVALLTGCSRADCDDGRARLERVAGELDAVDASGADR